MSLPGLGYLAFNADDDDADCEFEYDAEYDAAQSSMYCSGTGIH